MFVLLHHFFSSSAALILEIHNSEISIPIVIYGGWINSHSDLWIADFRALKARALSSIGKKKIGVNVRPPIHYM